VEESKQAQPKRLLIAEGAVRGVIYRVDRIQIEEKGVKPGDTIHAVQGDKVFSWKIGEILDNAPDLPHDKVDVIVIREFEVDR
jgi:hypothetical protein